MYLFHNIYGDCDHLLDTLPDNVTAVPFGWDAATEQARNDLLAELGQSIPGLPCLMVESEGGWVAYPFVPSDHPTWDTLPPEAPNDDPVPDEPEHLWPPMYDGDLGGEL